MKESPIMDPVFDAIRKRGIDPKGLLTGSNALKFSKIIQRGLISGKSSQQIALEVAGQYRSNER